LFQEPEVLSEYDHALSGQFQLSIVGLGKYFPAKKGFKQIRTPDVVHNIFLTAHAGTTLVLLGRNGAGKTTLIDVSATFLGNFAENSMKFQNFDSYRCWLEN
jgi:ABC-type multidrug transport system ATPase subunit